MAPDESVVRIKVGDDCYSISLGKTALLISGYTTYGDVKDFADAIRKAIADAVDAERARCQKWLDVGQNEMDRAYNGIVEGRNWRDG